LYMIEALKRIVEFLFFPQPEYTFLNTFVYAVEFVLASYLFFIFLKRFKIKIDKKLVISFSSFVLFGSSLRVLEDVGIVKSIFLITPLIYLLVGLILVFVLLVSLALQKNFKIPYHKTSFLFGLLLSILNLSFLVTRIINLNAVALVLAFLLPWLILLKIVKWRKENKAVLLAQIFDATVTFIGVNFFGYREIHVFPNFLIEIFSPLSFIFLKAFVVFSVLVLLDKYLKKKEERNFIKLIVGTLGASTGIRDFLRILLLV
jgi:uncharacterized membrane protein